MIDRGNNPHTEILPYGAVVYWQSGVACGKHDNWTHAEVHALGQWPKINFERSQLPEMSSVLALMEKAYVCGKADKASELRRMLGLPGNPVPGWTP